MDNTTCNPYLSHVPLEEVLGDSADSTAHVLLEGQGITNREAHRLEVRLFGMSSPEKC